MRDELHKAISPQDILYELCSYHQNWVTRPVSLKLTLWYVNSHPFLSITTNLNLPSIIKSFLTKLFWNLVCWGISIKGEFCCYVLDFFWLVLPWHFGPFVWERQIMGFTVTVNIYAPYTRETYSYCLLTTALLVCYIPPSVGQYLKMKFWSI